MAAEKPLNTPTFLLFREINSHPELLRRYRQYEKKYHRHYPGPYREILDKSTWSETLWRKKFFEQEKIGYVYANDEIKTFYKLAAEGASFSHLKASILDKLFENPDRDILKTLVPLRLLYEYDPFLTEENPTLLALRDFIGEVIDEKLDEYVQYGGEHSELNNLFITTLMTYQPNERLNHFIHRTNLDLTRPDIMGSQMTPLQLACRSGNIRIVRLLLSHNALPNVRESRGCTALHFACRYASLELVKLLIESGADPTVTDRYHNSVLNYACLGMQYETIDYLLDSPLNLSLDDATLYHASKTGNVNLVESLIKRGAPINPGDHVVANPLEIALQNGYLPVVKCLLNYRAKTRNIEQNSPIEIACKADQVETLAYLLERGKYTFQTHPQHFTYLLFLAVENNCLSVIEFLLEQGVNINSVDEDGLTTIDHALISYNSQPSETIPFLLSKGANIHHITPKTFVTFAYNTRHCSSTLEIAASVHSAMQCFLLIHSVEHMPLETDPEWDAYWEHIKTHYDKIVAPACKEKLQFHLLLLCALRAQREKAEISDIIASAEKSSVKYDYGKCPLEICRRFHPEVLDVVSAYVAKHEMMQGRDENMPETKRIKL